MEELFETLKSMETYYLATTDGTRPHVRPFGTYNIFEGKLYLQTGASKEVAKQLRANPHAEITAYNGSDLWIRVSCTLVEDNRVEARESMLDAYPELRSYYKTRGNDNIVFYLKDATVTYFPYHIQGASKTVKF